MTGRLSPLHYSCPRMVSALVRCWPARSDLSGIPGFRQSTFDAEFYWPYLRKGLQALGREGHHPVIYWGSRL